MHMRNNEGYPDPTASRAISNISKEEKCVHILMHAIRDIALLAGFEVIGRIEFQHRESGRHYK